MTMPTTTPMTRHRSGAALSALVLAFTFALVHPAQAQDDASRATREREALRRAQAALKVSQEQQAVLSREKSDLAAEKDKLDQTSKRSTSQLAVLRSDATRLRAEGVRLQSELTRLTRMASELEAARVREEAEKKSAQAQAQAQAQARADDLTRRLDDASRVAVDRTRTVASMTALLERATAAVAGGEKANREMYAFGLQMIEQVRARTDTHTWLRSESVLGFGNVRTENLAEEFKDRLAALRLPVTK